MATMNISLPQEMKDFIESQVATGRYANASDFVRDLVRAEQDKMDALAELNAEIQKGIDSGIAEGVTLESIWRDAVERHHRKRGVAAE
jgi:antitoxin ParD1/3/4